jgi:hypothetical protein
MLRALKVALVVVVPAVAIWVVIFCTARGPITTDVIPWFAGYLLVIAAPQLIVLAIGARRSSRHSAVIGGLVSLDAWLIFTAWWVIHSNDEAGVGWLIYLAASPLFAVAGIVLGKALARLTNR